MGLWFYTAPLWSAYSEKFHSNDFNWIKKTLYKSILLTFGLFILMIIVVINFEIILELWIGENNYYDKKLVIAIAILIGVRMWSGNFSTLLNGLGLTSLQMKLSIFTMIVNIPISIFFAKFLDLGLVGIAYGSSVSLALFALIAPFYTYNFIKSKDGNE
jgi:Na+-driven multidrug efflux pump